VSKLVEDGVVILRRSRAVFVVARGIGVARARGIDRGARASGRTRARGEV
jgi:hypothetical protein